MDFREKRKELLQRQQQLTANLGFVQGQLTLLDELEFPEKVEEKVNGVVSEVPKNGGGVG